MASKHGVDALAPDPMQIEFLKLFNQHQKNFCRSILSGMETQKPDWIRLYFNALLTDEKAKFIINPVDELASNICPIADEYVCEMATARLKPEVVRIWGDQAY